MAARSGPVDAGVAAGSWAGCNAEQLASVAHVQEIDMTLPGVPVSGFDFDVERAVVGKHFGDELPPGRQARHKWPHLVEERRESPYLIAHQREIAVRHVVLVADYTSWEYLARNTAQGSISTTKNTSMRSNIYATN
jgi:hypothetical protein